MLDFLFKKKKPSNPIIRPTDLTFTAFDVETANQNRNSICQIGLTRVENGITVFSKNYFVKPPNNEYDIWNSGIHNITEEVTEFSQTFPNVWFEISQYLDGQQVVAHNLDFDLDCLLSTLYYYNLPKVNFNGHCTYKMSNLKLIDLVESLGLEVLNHHDAKNDSKMCAEAYLKLLNGSIPNLTAITKKNESKFNGHEKLSGDILKQNLNEANKDSFFYNKKVVFTGVLESINRVDCAKIVQSKGADINTAISKKTDIVILGKNAGPSKMKEVEKLNVEGANIQIINEKELMDILSKE